MQEKIEKGEVDIVVEEVVVEEVVDITTYKKVPSIQDYLKENFYDKGQSINAETLTVKIRFFILLYKFTKNILKQFNFQQKHIRFIFLSVSLQKI